MKRQTIKKARTTDHNSEEPLDREVLLVRPSIRPSRFLKEEPPPIQFIGTGCAILDCVLGGNGYALGRIVNIVGDKSTGKTLIAIEACANFLQRYPHGRVWYTEVEAAFDKSYAASLGLPVDAVSFTEACFTVEDFFKHLSSVLKEGSTKPGLYILDSLDALSDQAELDREIDASSFGASKPKKLSELFRRLVQLLHSSNIALMIISQVRDNIGVTFGEKHSRSGGKALDFYASQILWLSQIGTIKRTIKGVERPVALKVRAKCKKNKLGPPLRECEFELRFGFGIDDVAANLTFLETVGALDKVDIGKDRVRRFLRTLDAADAETYAAERLRIADATRVAWDEIEKTFSPERRKY